MLTLLHGDNITESRKALTDLKSKAVGKEVRELDGKKLELSDLHQALESSSLFGSDTVVIIERLFAGLGRKKKAAEEVLGIIVEASTSVDIILWEDKEVSKASIDKLGPKKVVLPFKVSSTLFTFLDAIHPTRVKENLLLLDKALEHEAVELVYFMVVKRIRQLLVITSGGTLGSISPWQYGRLTTQARGFTMVQLSNIYESLLEKEYALKSGNTQFSFRQLLEQIFIGV